MSAHRALIAIALTLLAAACGDSTGVRSAPDRQPPAPVLHQLRWAGGAAPHFSAVGSPSTTVTAARADAGLGLRAYTAAFWAVRGQQRSVQINYQGGSDSTYPFLRLTVADPTYGPGLGDLAVGDSVLITIRVDSAAIKVSFEPTGLQFGDPAQLRVWYGGAAGDLNGDGVVDGADAYIEQQLLGIWYRETALEAWSKIAADQSVADKSFTSALAHFSEYAVSW